MYAQNIVNLLAHQGLGGHASALHVEPLDAVLRPMLVTYGGVQLPPLTAPLALVKPGPGAAIVVAAAQPSLAKGAYKWSAKLVNSPVEFLSLDPVSISSVPIQTVP
jgi:hypothetical protein